MVWKRAEGYTQPPIVLSQPAIGLSEGDVSVKREWYIQDNDVFGLGY